MSEDLIQYPEVDDPHAVAPSKPFRVFAQDHFTRQVLHWDLPVSDTELTYTLTGPNLFSGVIKTETESLKNLLTPNRTWIHVEDSGLIRASYLLSPFVDSPREQTRSIEGEGFSSYPYVIFYQGDPYQGVQVDPADMIRLIWAHVQSFPDGNLNIALDNTLTPVRIGTEPENVEFETGEGEDVAFVAGPYALNYWSVKNCGQEIEKLCKETPIEFVERSQWNESRTDVEHFLDMGYPRVGRKRDDLIFREGENLQELIPSYRENRDTYVSDVIVVGAGDGPSAIRAMASSRTGLLRKTFVYQDQDITTTQRAQAIADFELKRRTLSRYEIESIVVDTSMSQAPWGSFEVGDDIEIEAEVPYVGKIKELHRIIEIKYRPATKLATLSLRPSESFGYGEGTGEE